MLDSIIGRFHHLLEASIMQAFKPDAINSDHILRYRRYHIDNSHAIKSVYCTILSFVFSLTRKYAEIVIIM